MKLQIIGRWTAALWGTIFAMTGLAYETNVHEAMTENAFNSLYPDPNTQIFRRLGLTNDQHFAQPFSGQQNALDWMKIGSKAEDGIPRPAYHFYDPISGKGLNGNAVSLVWCPASVCTAAPDWAQNTDTANPNQTYSIQGARESFYNALTTTDSIPRSAHWATTFKALGQIAHLVQDMAQPQHVRNDLHFTLGTTSDPVLRNFSRYERFTSDLQDAGALNYRDYNGNNPVRLSNWRNYWTEQAGKGLAQFTNRYFVSQGTNFKGTGEPGYYQFPAVSETQEVPAAVDPTNYRGDPILDPNGVPYTNVQIQYLSINYTDSYTGLTDANPKLATKSYFDFVHAQNVGTSVYSMDNEVYASAAAILIPRAVGYSAGLIDYFFRGRLEISLPSDGVYGIVDHSTINQSDPSGFVGFSKLKLRVKNITPNENMSNGKLVAVAKFHRNACYQADLTGEFDEQHVDPQGNYYIPNCPIYRTADEEIVVSTPIEGVTLNFGDIQQREFTFPNGQEIPINARDLKLQVVYRGPLGEETDAVAVETQDISEPSYLVLLNSTDYFVWQGHYYTQATAPSDMPRDASGNLPITTEPVARTFRLYMDPNTPLESPTATVLSLQPGHYVRFAVLNGLPSYYARAIIHRPEDDVAVAALGGAGWTAAENQWDEETNYFSPLGILRNTRYFNLMWYFRSVDGTNAANDSEVTAPANPTPDPATAVNF